jgi:PEP-utilising enzyme, PEP-binding domain
LRIDDADTYRLFGGARFIVVMRREENSLKEIDTLQKIVPFAPLMTSYGMGWKALQAVRYSKSPASYELSLPPASVHTLILTIQPPEKFEHLYEPTHPAILRLLKLTVQAAHENNIWVRVCGEMAGEITLAPLLVGLGVDELSASPGLIPRVKKALQTLDSKECAGLVEDLRRLSSPTEILGRCEAISRASYPELLDLE